MKKGISYSHDFSSLKLAWAKGSNSHGIKWSILAWNWLRNSHAMFTILAEKITYSHGRKKPYSHVIFHTRMELKIPYSHEWTSRTRLDFFPNSHGLGNPYSHITCQWSYSHRTCVIQTRINHVPYSHDMSKLAQPTFLVLAWSPKRTKLAWFRKILENKIPKTPTRSELQIYQTPHQITKNQPDQSLNI